MPAAVLLFFFSPAPYRDFAVYGSLSLGAPWRSPDIDGRAAPSTDNRSKRTPPVKGLLPEIPISPAIKHVGVNGFRSENVLKNY